MVLIMVVASTIIYNTVRFALVLSPACSLWFAEEEVHVPRPAEWQSKALFI